MSKYDYELKLKIVEAYLNEEGGYECLAEIYNILSKTTIDRWIKVYKNLERKD